MTAEELARAQFEAEEDERMAVNTGVGSIKNPGLDWVIWKWENVTEEGRDFRIAIAGRVLEKFKK